MKYYWCVFKIHMGAFYSPHGWQFSLILLETVRQKTFNATKTLWLQQYKVTFLENIITFIFLPKYHFLLFPVPKFFCKFVKINISFHIFVLSSPSCCHKNIQQIIFQFVENITIQVALEPGNTSTGIPLLNDRPTSAG